MSVVCSSPADSEAMLRNEGRFPNRPAFGFLGKIRSELNLHQGISESNGAEWHKVT